MKQKLAVEKFVFLKGLTIDVIEEARVRDGRKIREFGPNNTGGTLITPGALNFYPAFWIRDYAMSLETGLIPIEEQKHMLMLTASTQQEKDWYTPSGSFVPRGSIADHITLRGQPIFFPGTIDDYENQGGIFGKLPSLDDHYYFIHMAWYYIQSTKDQEILTVDIKGIKLIDRLDLAFAVPPSSQDTHLVCCHENDRGVSFGFVDHIIHTGNLLICSILKYQAAKQMIQLHHLLQNQDKANDYSRIADSLRASINTTFGTDSGFLRASTGKSNQKDVWGTAFAVYADVLEADLKQKACRALAKAYTNQTIAWRGNIRHVPVGDDFNHTTAWQKVVPKDAINTYQNGAYWGTPTGWVAYAIAQIDEELALNLAQEYIEELEEGDFRKGSPCGSPWECIHPDNNYRKGPVYMTSVTCPLAAFQKLKWDIPQGALGVLQN
ncbi:MAG: hypothetical protein ABIG61_03250 [Planctomycetota bacterium]